MITRHDFGDFRYYSDGEKFIPSVTTITGHTMPTSPFLKKWYKDNGFMSDLKMKQAADFGTFYHILCDHINTHERITIHDMYDILAYNAKLENWHPEPFWIEKANKYLHCWVAFLLERDVTIIESEYMVSSEIAGYPVAGTIDFIGVMTFNRKKVKFILDIKSRDTGAFYDSEQVQLRMYQEMLKHQMDVDMIFNFSPKNYSTDVPTYTLMNQTDKKSLDYCIRKVKDFYEIHKIPETKLTFPDAIDLNKYAKPVYKNAENIQESEAE